MPLSLSIEFHAKLRTSERHRRFHPDPQYILEVDEGLNLLSIVSINKGYDFMLRALEHGCLEEADAAFWRATPPHAPLSEEGLERLSTFTKRQLTLEFPPPPTLQVDEEFHLIMAMHDNRLHTVDYSGYVTGEGIRIMGLPSHDLASR